MEFQIINCPSCNMMGFYTMNELAAHHLSAHERPIDRLYTAEATPTPTVIGYARLKQG